MISPLRTLPSSYPLQGKRVLVRVDFNVPLKKVGSRYRVVDDSRLRNALPTIVRLSRAGARVVLITHIGEPGGRVVRALSTAPAAARLAELLPAGIPRPQHAAHWEFLKLRQQVAKLRDGQILCLENVRFCQGEKTNDPVFSKKLAALADLYMNEAFSVSHRAHASVVGVCRYLPHFAGWQLMHEVEALERVSRHARPPFVLVLGGAKVHDKTLIMINLAPRLTSVLLGGVIANTILHMTGHGIGSSRVDGEPPRVSLRRLLKQRRRVDDLTHTMPLLQLPSDVVVARRLTAPPHIVDFAAGEDVPADESIFDIGPHTAAHYARVLAQAETILWNGPLGLIERPSFAKGSRVMAEAIARQSRRGAFSAVGGGDSLAVLSSAGLAASIGFVSTGGGAMLEYLTGKTLPGLKPLLRKRWYP